MVDRLPSVSAGGFGNWPEQEISLENYSQILQGLVNRLSSKENIKILDAGCGNGVWVKPVLEKLRGRISKVTYVDIQQKAIDEAVKNTPEGINSEYIVGDVRGEIFDNQYDFIHFTEVLHFLNPQDQIDTLKHLKKYLTESGVIYISVCSIFNNAYINHNENRLQNLEYALEYVKNKKDNLPLRMFHQTFQRDMYFFTERTIRDLAKETGFKVEEVEFTRNFWFPNGLGAEYPEGTKALLKK